MLRKVLDKKQGAVWRLSTAAMRVYALLLHVQVGKGTRLRRVPDPKSG